MLLAKVERVPRLLFNKKSAAKVLDLSKRMVEYAIAAGQLEVIRVNTRVLITGDSLRRFAASDQHVPKIPRSENRTPAAIQNRARG